jgi:hypothetical protein
MSFYPELAVIFLNHKLKNTGNNDQSKKVKKVKISLFQAVEAHRVARG